MLSQNPYWLIFLLQRESGLHQVQNLKIGNCSSLSKTNQREPVVHRKLEACVAAQGKTVIFPPESSNKIEWMQEHECRLINIWTDSQDWNKEQRNYLTRRDSKHKEEYQLLHLKCSIKIQIVFQSRWYSR